jgi:hypothetical protein
MTHTVILHQSRKPLAHSLIERAPAGSVMEIKPPRRTLPQNARLHAAISEIARAKPQGRVYPIEVWKALFMAMAGHKVRFEPALDGNGVVPIGFRTSRLSKDECSELIECIAAYAAEHGIELSE